MCFGNNSTPAKIAAAMILLSWLFLALAFLTSCVAIPVPPFGDHLGEAGTLHVSVSMRYEPRVVNSTSAAVNHAWSEFIASAPKTLHDK